MATTQLFDLLLRSLKDNTSTKLKMSFPQKYCVRRFIKAKKSQKYFVLFLNLLRINLFSWVFSLLPKQTSMNFCNLVNNLNQQLFDSDVFSLKCPPQAHVLKAWLPAWGSIWRLQALYNVGLEGGPWRWQPALPAFWSGMLRASSTLCSPHHVFPAVIDRIPWAKMNPPVSRYFHGVGCHGNARSN